MKTGFLTGKWVRFNKATGSFSGQSVADPEGQIAVLGTYDGEGWWKVSVFYADLPPVESMERALAGKMRGDDLVAHEDDLTLDPERLPLWAHRAVAVV